MRHFTSFIPTTDVIYELGRHITSVVYNQCKKSHITSV